VTSADITGSGLAFPLDVDAHGAVALSTDERDIEEAISIIVGTAQGERPMRPEFGCAIHDYVFETIDAYTLGRLDRAIRRALERWEPRIEVLAVGIDTADADEGRLLIDIAYSIRATNDQRNLVYPFYVIPAEESG
jgi:phage baseplate assembly protein W